MSAPTNAVPFIVAPFPSHLYLVWDTKSTRCRERLQSPSVYTVARHTYQSSKYLPTVDVRLPPPLLCHSPASSMLNLATRATLHSLASHTSRRPRWRSSAAVITSLRLSTIRVVCSDYPLG